MLQGALGGRDGGQCGPGGAMVGTVIDIQGRIGIAAKASGPETDAARAALIVLTHGNLAAAGLAQTARVLADAQVVTREDTGVGESPSEGMTLHILVGITGIGVTTLPVLGDAVALYGAGTGFVTRLGGGGIDREQCCHLAAAQRDGVFKVAGLAGKECDDKRGAVVDLAGAEGLAARVEVLVVAHRQGKALSQVLSLDADAVTDFFALSSRAHVEG